MAFKKTALVCAWSLLAAAALSYGAPQKGDAAYLYNRGLAEQRSGNLTKALDSFKSSSEADPTFAQPLLAAGIIYKEQFEREMRGYEEACGAFDKLMALLEANPPTSGSPLAKAYHYEGMLHLKGGDYEAALADLDKYLKIDPESLATAEVQNARGIACYYLDKYDQAAACFKNALKIDPGYAQARFNLRSVFTRINAYSDAQVFYRSGNPEKALKSLAALSEIAPRYLAGRRLEAKILSEQNKPEESIIVYREILSFQPDDPETYWMRIDFGRTLLGIGRKDEARKVLLENLARFPNVEDQRARLEVLMLLAKTGGN